MCLSQFFLYERMRKMVPAATFLQLAYSALKQRLCIQAVQAQVLSGLTSIDTYPPGFSSNQVVSCLAFPCRYVPTSALAGERQGVIADNSIPSQDESMLSIVLTDLNATKVMALR
jgi:hypothetical protein